MSALATWPGRPSRHTPCGPRPPTWATMSGLPGLRATPCTSTSPPGSAPKASTVWSRMPADEPPDTATTSCSRASRARVAESSPKSSRTRPAMVGSAPASRHRAARLWALTSRTLPGGGVCSSGTTSSPADRMATRGRRTATSLTPKAANSPMSWGLRRRPAGSSSSPAAASSPRRMTLSPGAWLRVSSMKSPAARREYSTMTTQSAPVRQHAAGGDARPLSGVQGKIGVSPMRLSPTTLTSAGLPSCAPNTSRAATA